VRTWTDSLLLR
jgi:hypothetical protein